MTPIESIVSDMNWRLGELASLKSIPFRYHMQQSHIWQLKKHLVPAIYALWEGFVVNSFEVYIKQINSRQIRIEDIDVNILLYMTEADEKLCLSTPRFKRESKLNFVENIKTVFGTPVHIPPKVVTKSNVNYEVANNLLTCFNMRILPACYKHKLDKLLKFRNMIAHGDRAITVKDEDISVFSQLVNDLMAEITERVEEAIEGEQYLKS